MAMTFKQWVNSELKYYRPEGWTTAYRSRTGMIVPTVFPRDQAHVKEEWFKGLSFRYKAAGRLENTIVINGLGNKFHPKELTRRWR